MQYEEIEKILILALKRRIFYKPWGVLWNSLQAQSTYVQN